MFGPASKECELLVLHIYHRYGLLGLPSSDPTRSDEAGSVFLPTIKSRAPKYSTRACRAQVYPTDQFFVV